MALHWDFREKAGTLTQIQRGQEYTLNFYEGNALMITTYEYKDDDGRDMYDMMWFFCDEAHAKNCLGLAKNAQGEKRNIFADEPVTHLTINRDHCRHWLKIADLFTRAFPGITIDIRERSDNA